MATYKVLQDIEAEDKLLGPLTLKQFIFAIIFIVIGFVNFKLITTPELSVIRWPIVIALAFPMTVFGFLAAPISRDQPNDVWLLARLRFLVKPHTRTWNQDGMNELVTITAPKKVERVLTNGLDQNEVESRLSALASTLDSRGWAVKNVDVNLFAQPNYLLGAGDSDRLITPTNLPTAVAAINISAADDILDATSNSTAHHLDQMIQASTVARRQQAVNAMQNIASGATATAPKDYWFMNQPSQQPSIPVGMATFSRSKVIAPGSVDTASLKPTYEEQAVLQKAEQAGSTESIYTAHQKIIQPLSHEPMVNAAQKPATLDPRPFPYTQPLVQPAQTPIIPPVQPSITPPNPAILKLANNDDLNIATIARQAQRISESDGEVTISLH